MRGLMLGGILSLAVLGPLNPLWFPYGAFVRGSAGNPNWDAYAGQAGSTYDSAANPAQTNGTVTYNPRAPLTSVSPTPPGAAAPRP